MRYADRNRTIPLRDLTVRDIERMEGAAFERDFAASRHNRSMDECRCTGPGPVCRNCPERDAPNRGDAA